MAICYQGVNAKQKKKQQQNKRIRGNAFIFIRCTSFSSNVNFRMNESHAHKQVYFHLSPALGSSHVK